MSDLTERLRLITVYSVRASKSVLGTKPIDTANASIQEAADALEAQEARIARLEAAINAGVEVNVPELMEWVADRLVSVYGESPHVDYVLSLRERASNLRDALTPPLK